MALPKQFRLTKESQFKKLRDQGFSRANPLVVLYALPNETGLTRIGVTASKRIGRAVIRNRVRRLIKEAFRLRLGLVQPGWDVLFIARQPIATANFQAVSSAVDQLLRRAGLLERPPRDAIGDAGREAERGEGTVR
ncbi:MAG: ribonuclease P protein component [Chloroflexi bacterium]|nr:ribonuclease P protein component [Chloroflexota bacterium]